MKLLIFLLVILTLAVFFDYKLGKIPNVLILCGVIAGISCILYYQNIKAALSYVPGIILPLILLYPFYKIGTLGAGDIKLFSLIGFYITFKETIFCIILSFFIGAVISFFYLISKKNLKERICYLFYYLKACISEGHIQYYYQTWNLEEKEKKLSQIHFSLPILLSVIFLFVK